MPDNTPIEWTDATWNPIRARNLATGLSAEASAKAGGIGHFCIHMSEGCRNCYAERLQPRFQNPIRFAAQDRDKVEIYLDETVLTQPLRWKRPRKIFPCSMTDLFGDWVTDAMLDRVFAVMALCPHHTFQIVTKRPERMAAYFADKDRPLWVTELMMEIDPTYSGHNLCGSDGDGRWPPPNVWLGVSVEDQKTADQRIPILLDTPAAIRFISAEPLLGPIDIAWALSRNRMAIAAGFLRSGIFSPGLEKLSPLDWVIAGGESGPNARPAHPDWFRALSDQCQSAGAAFLFKQWGEFVSILDREIQDPDWRADYSHEFAHGERFQVMERVGKKAAGRQLDGRTWDEFPS